MKKRIGLGQKTLRGKQNAISEALFLIANLLISTFAFSFLIAAAAVVASPSAKAATTACCEKTKTGLFCQNALSDSCDPAFRSAPTSCDATSFCKLGCCYDSVEGTCAENTPRKVCEAANGTFDTHADCKIGQCAEGCCVLGSEASLTTLVRCKKLAGLYGLETDFRSSVTKEADCTAIAQAQDKGACVIATPTETTCKFTTRGECKTLTHNETAFNKDFLCSAEKLATNCARQARTGCIEGKDEVYWFDSCGNPENIYDSDKARSYNSGKVLSKEQSCNPSSANANSPGCGNCQYFLGSMCGTARAGKEPKPTFGENICRDLNCYKTSNGNDYKHGESWCVYDAAVGEGKDVVGSRHWRHLCVQGEEIVEPCDDYRQSICVEDKTTIEGKQFNEAVCRANNWRGCLDIKDQAACGKERGCYWRQVWKMGMCLPDVPPGFKLNSKEGGSVANTICSMVNVQCPVLYEKKWGGWKCVQNCECLESSWTENMLKACTNLGDCGAKVNILGELTTDGYQISEGANVGSGFFDTFKKIVMAKGSSISGRAVTGLAGEEQGGQAQGGEKKEGGGGAATGALGLLGVDKVSNAINALTIGKGGIFWNVGICTTAAFFAGKMVAGMFGLKGDAANFVAYSSAAAAGISSAVASATGVTSTSAIAGSTLTAGTITSGTVVVGGTTVTATAAAPITITSTGATIGGTGATAGTTLTGTVTANSAVGGSSIAGTAGFAATIGTVLIAVVVVMIIAIILMKVLGIGKTKTKNVTFTCMPWQPPSGGANCEKCNGDAMKPCSDYRCSALGASCSLLNEGTGNEACVWLNRGDTLSPVIKPMKDVLTSGHSYQDVKPCPPGPGCWKIVRTGATDGCIKAFTPLTFGIETDEPAQCKVDYNHTSKFDDMQFVFGDNLYLYNHTMKMSLPGPGDINAESPELQNDGKYTLFIRCRDGNGNANSAEMAMQFCVEPGPDTTPARIERTSIENGAPVAYGTRNAPLDLFLNEPAECRWSRTDQAYENMNNTFTCATFIEQMELDMTYRCFGTLTGIQDKVENVFYFRCMDQPWLAGTNESDRNANKESYVFTLQGTTPLNISKVKPNGTISYGSEPVPITLKAETINGYDNGRATCYYSLESYDNLIEFFKTGTAEHEQKLDLMEGDYTAYVLCRDLGGNVDKMKTAFRAEVDTTAPKIIRVYQDAGMLKIITDEESECKYGVKDCNFDFLTATEMPFTLSTEHTADWRTDITYYIKCKDKYGNMPLSSECTMQVNAYDVPVGP